MRRPCQLKWIHIFQRHNIVSGKFNQIPAWIAAQGGLVSGFTEINTTYTVWYDEYQMYMQLYNGNYACKDDEGDKKVMIMIIIIRKSQCDTTWQ